MQGGECAAVRALQAGANAATRRLWKPKTHLFIGKYLDALAALMEAYEAKHDPV
jgi:hypothetical protein